MPPGDVVVLDNAGRLDCTVWGDILTAVSHRRGIGGTVIHGVCRDVSRALELGYPIFSRGRYMRTGKDRVEVESMQAPISLGEVQVRQDDQPDEPYERGCHEQQKREARMRCRWCREAWPGRRRAGRL